jgi:hypothetical protein
MFQEQLVQVSTVTYKNGIVSKRYLDAKTGLPFHVEWTKPQVLSHSLESNTAEIEETGVGHIRL